MGRVKSGARRVKSALRAGEIAACGSSVGGVGNAVGIYRPCTCERSELSCQTIMPRYHANVVSSHASGVQPRAVCQHELSRLRLTNP